MNSFADPEHGHHGGIYQAGGWSYVGMTDLPEDEYIVNGRRMHGRALRSTRAHHKAGKLPAVNVFDWARNVLDPGIKRVPGSRKYRYLMPIDDEMRSRIAPLARPYPKRAGSAVGGMPADQAGGGGSIPTPALSAGTA